MLTCLAFSLHLSVIPLIPLIACSYAIVSSNTWMLLVCTYWISVWMSISSHKNIWHPHFHMPCLVMSSPFSSFPHLCPPCLQLYYWSIPPLMASIDVSMDSNISQILPTPLAYIELKQIQRMETIPMRTMVNHVLSCTLDSVSNSTE